MNFRLKIPFISLLLGFNLQAATVKSNLDFSIHQDYISTRAMAMGNAFTAVVDDHSAMFYNPAVLAIRKKGIVRAYLKGAFSDSFFGLLDDLSRSGNNPSQTGGLNEANEILSSNLGKSFLGRGSLGGIWARPGWSIGFIPMDIKIDLAIHKQGPAALSVNSYLDTTFAYAYATDSKKISKMLGGKFYWGVTGKLINRVFYSDTINPLSISQGADVFDKSRASEGLVFDVDLGTYWTPKVPKKGMFSFFKVAKPSFAVVMRNALDYGYMTNLQLLGENSNTPTKLKRRLDLGSKWDLPNFWVFDPHMGFDVRDILHENWTIKKGVHVGAELFWEMFSWWKGHWSMGINQGYLSYGVGARFALFRLDISSWGDEVSSDSAPIESRRYMIDMSLEF